MSSSSTQPRRFQAHLGLGLALVALFWWSNWHPGRLPLLPIGFFGLWLGYILTLDGLIGLRTGTSPLARSWRCWLAQFLVSVPAWWLFEYLNRFLNNWTYLGLEHFSPLGRLAYSSLSFSIVIPAVFTSAELLASLRPRASLRWIPLPMTPRALTAWIACGLVLLGGIVAQPRMFYPATWLAVLFVLDPVNHLAGRPAVAARLQRGEWRLVALLGAGALGSGIFWELWNYHSYPKWIYHIPLFGRSEALALPHLFEMPLLGYLGYIPFGLELYALYHFLVGLVGLPEYHDLHFDRAPAAASGQDEPLRP